MTDAGRSDARDYGPVSLPLWRALRNADRALTVAELHELAGAGKNAVAHRLRQWKRAGLVEIVPPEPRRFAIAAASKDMEHAPTQGPLSRDAWAALRRLGGSATFPEILAACGADDRPLYCRLRRWAKRRHLTVTPGSKRRFVLSADAPASDAPPRVSADGPSAAPTTGKDRMWSAMRVLKTFDFPLLTIVAEVNVRQVNDYVSSLKRAGYVAKIDHPMAPSKTSPSGLIRSHGTYRLLMNTGPKAPTTASGTTSSPEPYLIDHNTGDRINLGWVRPRGNRAGEAGHGE